LPKTNEKSGLFEKQVETSWIIALVQGKRGREMMALEENVLN
jgi:hypothetical protein